MPECLLRAFSPITPGKLAGLEIHVFGLQAEEDLAAMGRMHGAFNGGDAARRHAHWLEDRIEQYHHLRDGTRRRSRCSSREEVAAFAQLLKDRGY